MRLETLKIHNLGPFRDFSVDLTELPGPLVAFTGPNGSGKSTALELGLPGAMYRDTPTRGSLVGLATARDASLEVRLVNGKSYTIRHVMDAVSKKSEAVVLGADGAPLLDSSKVRDFDGWAAQHLPAPEVLFASVFASQGTSGFLGMRDGERKAVLLRVLGVERLEVLAERARERARLAKAELGTAEARLRDELARSGDPEETAAQLDRARAEADRARAAAEEAAGATARAKAALDDATAAAARFDAHGAALRAASARAAELGVARDDLARRIANNEAVLADEAAIRGAATVLTEEQAARDEASRLESEQRLHTQHASQANREAIQAELDAGDAADQIAALSATLEQAPAIEEAVSLLPALRAEAERADAVVSNLAAELEDLRGRRLAGATERIGELRGGLDRIRRSDGGSGAAARIAADTLDADTATEDAAAELPALLAAATARLGAARDVATQAARDVSAAERLSALADRIPADRAALCAQESRRDTAKERARAKLAERDALLAQEAAAQGAAAQARGIAAKLAERAEELRPLAAKAEPLAFARVRLEELRPQLTEAEARLAVATDEVRRLESERPPAALSDEALALTAAAACGAREREQTASKAAATATQQVGAAEAAHAAALAAAERLAALRAEHGAIEADLADWTRLASDLGRDGLQAAEIDAAGPELTALTNDLLHTCHGPRWTVRVDTQRASSDGRRMLEGCTVQVIDTVAGREAEGQTFSGGERVLLGEALSLALTMLACRRAGIDRPTLVRDESGAALDPENARVYVAMLRRAAQTVGADKVLFVSHLPEVVALADSVVEVAR